MRVRIEESVGSALAQLRGKDVTRVLRKSLTASVRILRKESVANFRKGRTTKGRRIRMKTTGLIQSKRVRRRLAMEIKIVNWKARIFEVGAEDRHTMGYKSHTYTLIDGRGDKVKLRVGGKARPTGSIKPVHFFRDARISKEREIYDTFNTQLVKVFKDLWSRGKIRKK